MVLKVFPEKNIENCSFRLLALTKTLKIARFDCWLWKKHRKLFAPNLEVDYIFKILLKLPQTQENRKLMAKKRVSHDFVNVIKTWNVNQFYYTLQEVFKTT